MKYALLLCAVSACTFASAPASEPVSSVYWSDGDSGRIDGVDFRLADVDAPETGGVGAAIGGAKCERERELGFKAKAFMVDLTKNADVDITHREAPDRYGRVVVQLSADGQDVAEVAHISLQKLRRGLRLTDMDLTSIEQMLIAGGVGNSEQVHALATANGGLAGYVRSVVGMDRNAVAAALNQAMSDAQGAPASSEQLDFLNKVVDWLSEKGRIDPGKLWEKPFTGQHPAGVSGIFDQQQSTAIVSAIRSLTASESA